MRNASLFVGLSLVGALSFGLPATAQGMCTSSGSTNCYRFLCNSMDANGAINGDGCPQGCSNNSAARWGSPTIPIRVDRNTAPASLGAATWSQVVNDTLAAWAGVSSSNLVLQDIGPAQYRGFGTDSQNEVFWILNVSEWQQKVGAGVNGALGVTLPRYTCGNPRQLFAADLVMNGAGFTNWRATQAQCTTYNCLSARSTLLHELGHWVGLGHPCRACAWSAMSAQAYSEPDYPLASDAAGVSALYPGSPGGMGYGCSTSNQCNSGLSCQQVDDVRYCTRTCGSCPEGFVCDDVNGTDLCIYDAGPLARPGDLGEPCPSGLCETGLSCVLSQGDSVGTCYRDCTSNAQCGNEQECVPIEGGGGVCVSTTGGQGVGQPCAGSNDLCQSGLVCVVESLNAVSGICRNQCNPTTGAGCFANEACLPLQGGTGACFPVGNVQEGGACEDALDCAQGLVCLIDGPNDAAHCYQRCDGEHECRHENQSCYSLQGSSISYCDVGFAPGEGEGEGEGETELPPNGCHLSRGNYDCPNGFECKDDGNDDRVGHCVAGESGSVGTWGLCDNAGDCVGGICHNGVCTRPCDFGCADGYECDTSSAPGGLCKALSCREEEGICDASMECVYSSASRYVCAIAPEQRGVCNCSTAEGSDPTPALALLGVLGLLAVRRRRG